MSRFRDPIWQFMGVVVSLVAIIVPLLKNDQAWIIIGCAVALVIIVMLLVGLNTEPTIDSFETLNPTPRRYTKRYSDQPQHAREPNWLLILTILGGTLGGLIGNTMNLDVRATLIGICIGIGFGLMTYAMTRNL